MNNKTALFIVLLVIMVLAGALGVFGGSLIGIIATCLMIIGGLTVLILGGNSLVEGASSIAIRYAIPPLVIGMSILAMGTSMPELFVNVIAAFQGESGLLLANVIGSNISNLLLIIGVTALIAALFINDFTIRKDLPISIGAGILLLILMQDTRFGEPINYISRVDSIILLTFFGIFLWQLFRVSNNDDTSLREQVAIEDQVKTPEKAGEVNMPWAIFQIALGIGGLYVGGEALVTHASALARMLDVSTVLIGASIVAIGTSVPELATSVIAALKKKTDMAVGNIIGSNIFNLLWIIGATGVIQPIAVDGQIFTDLWIFIIASTALFLFLYFKKEKIITKYIGVIILLGYIGYTGFLLWRG